MTKVKAKFNANPDLTVLYTTSNGFLFLVKSDAHAHGDTLKDKTVTTHFRPAPETTTGSKEAEAAEKAAKEAEAAEKAAKEAEAAEKAAKEAEVPKTKK